MGLEKQERKTYLRISKGHVSQTVQKDTPGATMVEIKDDDGNIVKTKYELQFTSVSGIVKNIKIQPSGKPEFPDSLVIEMEDGIDYFYVQISIDSSLSNKIINKFCNPKIDWKSPIKISPYYFEDTHSNAIVVEQNGEKIEPYFTQKDPKGMPVIPKEILDIEKSKRTSRQKNEIKKVMLDITAFLQDYFAENIIPVIRNQQPKVKDEGPATSQEPQPEEPEDDLPF